jgi:surface protein
MFMRCTSLVGGQGTVYNYTHADKTYAHIDGGTSNPGYLTDINSLMPYAYYTPENTTLTFYYDGQRSSRSGTTYNLNTGDLPNWYYDDIISNVTKVVFDSSFADARPTSTYFWFCNMSNLESIEGLSNLNTSEVTNMSCMFISCEKITSFDLSRFNTSNVTKMNYMFAFCSKLESLDLSKFNTSKVTDMSGMFYGSTNLQTIYVGSGWSTAAATNSKNMFADCNYLVGGKGTTWNSSNPTDKTYAHIDSSSNPGYFTASNETMSYACYTPENTTLTFYCDKLRSSRPGTTYNLNTGSNVPRWENDDIRSNVTKVVFDSSFADVHPTTTYYWFVNMANLESIEGMNYLNTSEVTSMRSMFYGCSKLTSLDLSSFNTAKVTSMHSMFYGCSKLTSLVLSSFTTAKVTDMSEMFYGSKLTSLDLSSFNTAKVTDMSKMFYGSKLTSLDLSSFNTAKVTDMSEMFWDCTKLQIIYVGSGWSTAEVTNSSYMFDYCSRLVGGKGTSYDENHVDKTYAHIDGGTSNPGYFTDKNASVAYACYTPSNTTLTFYYDGQRSSRDGTTYNLNTGDLPIWYYDGKYNDVTDVVFDSSFAGAHPTTTYDWFYNMSNLESIDGLSNLNTSEVTNMRSMFSYCVKLTSLDLSGFNTANVTNMMQMFYGCTSLQTIYVGSGWSTAEVTNSFNSFAMFSDCTSLVGGKGTTYDENNINDATYAHIDGGPTDPGYFTERTTGIATGIENSQKDAVKGQSEEWYTLDGRKISGEPTKRGVYIQKGRAVVK